MNGKKRVKLLYNAKVCKKCTRIVHVECAAFAGQNRESWLCAICLVDTLLGEYKQKWLAEEEKLEEDFEKRLPFYEWVKNKKK